VLFGDLSSRVGTFDLLTPECVVAVYCCVPILAAPGCLSL
jgi:hypothetical protein